MTREQAETALANGTLYANMGGGKWWRCRRNGRTKLWKTRPNEWRIPLKAGFYAYGYIDHDNCRPGNNCFRIEPNEGSV